MARSFPSSLRRLHQMNGPAGTNPVWFTSQQYNWKFNDVPQSFSALGRRCAAYVPKVRLVFSGSISSTGGTAIPRKVLTPMLISSVQIQGTEIGTPVSSSHMLGGIIDTDSYIRSGCRNSLFNGPGITLAAATPKAFNHVVDIYLANYAQKKGWETAPLALFLQPGEILVNTPQTLSSVHSSLADVTLSNVHVTCHAEMYGDTEIRIANPWQLTRHKSNAGNGTDSVSINSFGAASTLTGVLSKCGIHSILWAGSSLIGSAAGSGTVASITQFSADFLGLRQNNDPRAIVQELFDEITDGRVIDTNGVSDTNNALYPFFDLQAPAAANLDVMLSAEFFPVMFPVRDFDASKLLSAVGNPSYDLTGTFTPGSSHYTYVEGCYPFTLNKLGDLTAVVQRSHLALELYGSDDVLLDTKLADNQNVMEVASTEGEKLSYLPRVLKLRPTAAVK